MATFKAIGFNLAAGSSVCALSLVAFSAAVHFGFNSQLAPRTWARPRDVIKNVLPRPYGLRWISWALNLSYQEMLEGIPGTGTRSNGWSGTMLKCNLDGIVMVKFHALCLRVAIFATILCCAITLPLNYTAPCDPLRQGEQVCANITDLTHFEQTTLANIPSMDTSSSSVEGGAEESEAIDEGLSAFVTSSFKQYFQSHPGITSRLFGVVLVAWCIYIYAFVLIWNEWLDNLALRRAFYLEHNHFESRKEELDYLGCLRDPEDTLQEERPPHLPHPEVRETVPNVCLYSVLYKLPQSYYTPLTTSSTASMVDRQLSSTVDFFDKCVPNQPGFSSSVAAVTILPDASHVSHAWKKWYACASKLRRLRFIRSRLRRLRDREEEILFQQQNSEKTPFLVETTTRTSMGTSSSLQQRASFATSFQGQASNRPHSASSTKAEALDHPRDRTVDFSGAPTTDSGSSSTLGTMTTGTPGGTSPALDTIQENDLGALIDDVSVPSNMDDECSVQVDNENSNAPLTLENPTAIDATQEESKTDNDVVESATMATSSDEPMSFANGEEAASLPSPELSVNVEEVSTLTPTKRIPSDNFGSSLDESPVFDDAWLDPLVGADKSITNPKESKYPIGSLDTDFTADSPPRSMQRLRVAKYDKRSSSKTVGLEEEAKLDMFFSDDGMEQLSVYCREFAQSSATCCPFGCDEFRIRLADIERLEELEEEAEQAVRQANIGLIEARASVNRGNFNPEKERSRELSLMNAELGISDEESIEGSNDGVESLDETNIVAESASMRKRSSTSCESEWQLANSIAQNNRRSTLKPRNASRMRHIASGRWHLPHSYSWKNLLLRKGRAVVQSNARVLKHAASKSGEIVNSVVQQSAYAVVTFTSRQAAIAARQCLADGSGLDRWVEIEDIPIPPLADAPPWNLLACRGVCRPVTMTINDNQKRCRNNTTIAFLTLFCLLYTIPLSLTSNLLSGSIQKAFPNMNLDILSVVSGLLSGLLYTLFFSVCPFIFKAFANFGSGATSIRQAEYRALRYYWIFTLVTSFTTSSLATMVTNGLYSSLSLGLEAQEVLRQVATTIPTQVSATWLNWIIVRFLITFPLTYLFQSNTFLFDIFRMKCCARLMRGGGPGGPMPYRLYVDSGVVFLCVVALAPACPLVAPAGMMYFLVFSPMIRWLLIFVYRPEYDGGGLRWPLIHEIFISALVVAQVLMTTMMLLKKAYGPAVLAAISVIPTVIFSQIAKDRFLRCYQDAGLLQTSQLDGWDTSMPTSREQREEYRKWLVDCHKASFVPICLSGLDNFLTAQPAVAISDERDNESVFEEAKIAPRPRASTFDAGSLQSTQRGALFRRTYATPPSASTTGLLFNRPEKHLHSI